MNKVVEYYNKLAPVYDECRFNNTYGVFIDAQERRILDALLNNKNEIILDLACGSGRLSNYATMGVDGSSKMTEIAKVKYPNKKFLTSDAACLPFDDNSVDTIISFHFFMHLSDENIEAVLREAHRILKIGGRIIFDIPSKKRRSATRYKSAGWHGANSRSIKDVSLVFCDLFEIKKSFGLLFLPIHRFPKYIRNHLLTLDFLLSNSWLKEYSSYLVIELKKK